MEAREAALRRALAAERDQELAAVVARLEEDALDKEAALQATGTNGPIWCLPALTACGTEGDCSVALTAGEHECLFRDFLHCSPLPICRENLLCCPAPRLSQLHCRRSGHVQKQLEAGEAAAEERWRVEVSRLHAGQAALEGEPLNQSCPSSHVDVST